MDFELVSDLEKLKALSGSTWKDMSDILGVDFSTFSRWKNRSSKPTKKNLNEIYNNMYKKKYRLNNLMEELYKDLNNENTRILFHGSKEGIVGDLSIAYSNEKRDFGKGFYLGESVKQAISFVSSYENSCLYFIKVNDFKNLRIKEYDVCKDWMILVAYFRGKIDEYSDSKYLKKLLESIKDIDIIIAPIADNSMYSIINEFIEGSITDLQCINSLSANRLGKQYVILNDSTLKNNVEIIRKSFICKLEKEDYEINKDIETNIGKGKMILAKRQFAGKGKYIEEILK